MWSKKEAVWAAGKPRLNQLTEQGRLYWGADGKSQSPRIKNFLSEAKPVVPRSLLQYKDVSEALGHILTVDS